MKTLSVIVPVYNTAQYLPKCLDSLLIESKSQLDVIVIIDGCDDGSYEIASNYAKQFPETFRVIKKENGGHGSCCNLGIKLSQGKYIRFLDSDDWLDTPLLQKIVTKLHSLDADMVLTKGLKEYVHEHRSEIYGFDFPYSDQLLPVEDIVFSPSINNPYFCTLATSIFSKSLLDRIGILFSEKVSFDDTIIYTLPFTELNSVYFFNECLYHYYIGRSGQSIADITPAKHYNLYNEHLYALSAYNKKPLQNYPKNVQKYLLFLLNLLTHSAYISLLGMNVEDGKRELTKFKAFTKGNGLYDKIGGKLHRLLSILPYRVVRQLFHIVNYRRKS